MTTLAAWIGIDSRGPSSLYIVSDSRVTFEGRVKAFDDGRRKVFACRDEPHLFGFCGWVDFPIKALGELIDSIDNGGFFQEEEQGSIRMRKVFDHCRKRLADIQLLHPRHPPFTILHAFREGKGLKSRFRVQAIGWQPDSGWCEELLTEPEESHLVFPAELSVPTGSGTETLLDHDKVWKKSEIGRTSRGVFSAFCDSLRAKRDPYTGGSPQLGGLFRDGRPMEFGIAYQGELYRFGRRVTSGEIPHGLECFNELFERVDPHSLVPLPHAQRHARPSWL